MTARPPASLIYNPKAGRRRHGDTLEAILAQLKVAYEIVATPTSAPRDAIRLAREAAARGEAAVFAWGGDGTIREAAEGLIRSPTALGVLPGGTFNVVALALGLPRRDPVTAAQRLASAKPDARDVGFIEETPFLMQATMGFDGYAMSALRPEMKAKYGMAGASIDVAGALLRYSFPWFDVVVDGRTHTVTGAAYVNMAEYGGAFEVVPGARWDDGRAHALLYTGRSRFAAARLAIGIAMRRHHRDRNVRIVEATTLEIPEGSSPCIQTDGDFWKGPRPARCRLAASALRVLVPAPR